jgi:neutral amino acid transport system substrate-binding protein
MKFVKTFLYLLLVVALSLPLVFIGCSYDDDDDDSPSSVTLGVILPMDASSGPLRENALRTAIDEINEAGGVSEGWPINLEVRSSEGDDREETAAAVANDILASVNNLVGFVTSFSSSSRGVALQVADPNNIPQISGSSTADANSGISAYFQRIAPPDNFQTLIMAQKAQEVGINTVAIAVQEGDAFGEGLAETFRTKFESLGGVISAEVNFIADDTDYEAKLTQLYEGSPDAVLIAMVSTDVEFLTEVDQSDIGLDKDALRFLLSDAQKTDDILTQAPAGLLVGEINNHPKSFGAVSFPDPNSPIFQHFASELEDRYDQEVASFNAQFYDIGYLFALAIERAAKTVSLKNINDFREAVNTNIRQVSRPDAGDSIVTPDEGGWVTLKSVAVAGDVNYEGASGNCDMDENGDVLTQYEVFRVIQNPDESFAFEAVEYVDPNGGN